MKRLALGVMALFLALVMIVACTRGSGKSKGSALGCAACATGCAACTLGCAACSGACASYDD